MALKSSAGGEGAWFRARLWSPGSCY